ncbi:hypothetical protein VE04_08703 [Pseudogymnoascus sp. 24MN13]|nr:hypothetical protein VE04_08703 [Pseudogymnoascus sp. 24MN13]
MAVCHNDEYLEASPIFSDETYKWCDVCTLGILEDEVFYKYGVCNGGDFDICSECYKIGGRCLGHDHGLTEILQGGSFPNLKCVTFEDVSEFVHYYIQSYVKRPNQAVKALCYEARVNFRERKICHFPKDGKQQPWFMNAMRIRRLRERKVEITTEDEYNPKDDVSDTETDVAGQDGGDSDPESGSSEFDSEGIDELGFFVDSEMELTSDDDFE